MYELIGRTDQTVVGVRIEEDITDEENRELVDLVKSRARNGGPVRLLVVYDADPGLAGSESLYDNMRFAKQAGEDILKMAVIGNRDWKNTWVGLFGLFGGIETAYYDQSRLEEALEWLKQ